MPESTTTTYALLRSVHESKVHLLVPADRIDALPDPHRTRGPWQVIRRGEVARLLPQFRAGLAADGSVLIEADVAVVQVECAGEV